MPEPTKRRHKDGTHTWETTCYLGRDAQGKRRRRRVTARTKDACVREAARVLTDAGRGDLPDPGAMTVAELGERWLATLGHISPNTRRRYAQHVRLHIVPAIGTVRLSRLSALHVEDFLAQQAASDLAPRTVGDHLTRLRQLCTAAVRWGLLARNPCDGARPPRVEPKEPAVWSPDDAQAFLAATVDDPLQPLWLVALATGLRIGELAALSWGDVELERGLLTVRRTMTKTIEGREILGSTTKSKRPRVVPLPEIAIVALRILRERWPGIGEAPVFATARGRRWRTDTLRARFAAACAAAGVPRLTPHGLRHSAKTWMEEAGLAAKALQAILGHTDVATTMRYGAVTPEMRRQVTAAMGSRLERREVSTEQDVSDAIPR